jgi:hypothetical protein
LHLARLDPQAEIERGERVQLLTEQVGWQDILDAVQSRVDQLQNELLTKPPREDAAQYERTIGEMRGLKSLPSIIEGMQKRAEEARDDV